MNHTPGPWTMEEYQELGMDGERRPATYIEATQGWAQGKRTVAIIGHWKDRPNPEADARLIAAAPELLEALQIIASGIIETESNYVHSKLTTTGMKRIAQEAIAKAKGE